MKKCLPLCGKLKNYKQFKEALKTAHSYTMYEEQGFIVAECNDTFSKRKAHELVLWLNEATDKQTEKWFCFNTKIKNYI